MNAERKSGHHQDTKPESRPDFCLHVLFVPSWFTNPQSEAGNTQRAICARLVTAHNCGVAQDRVLIERWLPEYNDLCTQSTLAFGKTDSRPVRPNACVGHRAEGYGGGLRPGALSQK